METCLKNLNCCRILIFKRKSWISWKCTLKGGRSFIKIKTLIRRIAYLEKRP